MRRSLPLSAYDAAWRLALGPLLLAARADAWLRGRFGKGPLPPEWRVEERLLLDSPSRPSTQGGEDGGGGEGVVWMHAASLGECQGLWALCESLEGSLGGCAGRFLLTAQTAAGLAALRRAASGRAARGAGGAPDLRMAPLDHPRLAGRFLDRHKVAALVLYESELWPGILRAASERGIPVLAVSARMTERALARYRIFQGTWGALLGRLDWIQARSPADAERFRVLTRAPVAAGADYKLLRHREALAATDAGRGGGAGAGAGPELRPVRNRLAFLSLHLRELRWFLPELPMLMERFPITVLPRRPGEMEAFRRVLIPLGFALHGRDPGARHALVDSLGRVGEVLPGCGSAFVGGSLVPMGCHSLWEPLLEGQRIYFGPSTHNQEPLAGLLLERGVAEAVTSRAQVRTWREPDSGTAAACRAIVRDQGRLLEDALTALRDMIGVHLSGRSGVRRPDGAGGADRGFYLNSGVAGGRELPPGRVESIG